MKKVKICTALILSLLMILTSSVTIFATGSTANLSSDETPIYVARSHERAVWLEGCDTEGASAIDAVKWYNKGGKYYFFMPSSIDLSAVKVYHKFGNLNIGGQSIVSGQAYDLSGDLRGSMRGDNSSYSYEIMQSENTGTMFITTDSGSMANNYADKNHKEPGDILVVSDDGSTIDYDFELDFIKGRGNTTWRYLDKKAFNLKLEDKAELMGMSKSKKWCLLANGQEHSMLRNRFAYDMADEIGLEFSPESKFVEFYANGKYMGSYQLSEKVDAGDDNLVKINELEKDTEHACEDAGYNDDLESYRRIHEGNKYYMDIPANPDDITGGYLLEINREVEELSGFVSSKRNAIDLKYPECASRDQMMYISSFYQDMEDAMYSHNGYNSKGKHYTEYIDIEDAARMYIIMEFSMDVDTGISSCFMYKDSDLKGDGKIHLSPVWDYDCALGNLTYTKDGVDLCNYNKMFASVSKITNVGNDTIFAALYKHGDFQSAVSRIWKEEFVPAYSIYSGETEATGRLQSFNTYKNTLLATSAKMNYIRWNLSDELLRPEIGYTHTAHIDYLHKWNNGRYNFLNKMFLEIEDVRELALESVNAVYDEYSKKDITSQELAQMTEIKDRAIKDIKNASSADRVNDIREEAVNDIKSIVDSLVIFFDNSEIRWSNIKAYWWGSTQTISWPGKAMEIDGDMAKITVPLDAKNIIFNNGGSKTVDLTIDPNKTIFVIETHKSGAFYTGTWQEVEDSLEEVQAKSKDEIILLYNSYDQATYTVEEYNVITDIKTQALADIDNATTTQEVETIRANAVSNLKTAEAKAIKYVKANAITEVNNAYAKYDSATYSADVYAEITNAKNTAIASINNATTETQIATAVENAKTAMQNISESALEDVKTSAIADVQSAFNAYDDSKFTASEYSELTSVKDNAINAIQNATSANAISTAKANAIADMKAISQDTLAIAKEKAVKELNSAFASYNSAEFTTEDYQKLTSIKNTGVQNINNATTKQAVTNAKTTAIKAMGEVGNFIIMYLDDTDVNWTNAHAYYWGSKDAVRWPGVKMEKDGDMFKIKVPSDAKNIIFNNGSNRSQTVNLTINKATPIFAVDSYRTGALYSGDWKAPSETLDQTKEKATTEINAQFNSYNKADYTTAEYNALVAIKNQAIADVTSATNSSAVNTIKANAISDLKTAEAKAIKYVKANAITEVNNAYAKYDSATYSADVYAEITNAKNTAIASINNATTETQIATAVENAKTAMQNISESALEDVKTSAIADVQSAFNAYDDSKFTASEYSELTSVKDNAINAIQNATSANAISTAKANAIADMKAISQDTLAIAKEKAVKELNSAFASYNSAEFTTEDYQKLTSIKNTGVQNINNATTKQAVTNAKTTAIKAMGEVGDFIIMYLDATNLRWSSAYAYYWGTKEPVSWPGVKMEKDGDLFKIKVPSDAKNIIFSTGSNSGQTVDLVIDKDTTVFEINSYKSGTKYNGNWTVK